VRLGGRRAALVGLALLIAVGGAWLAGTDVDGPLRGLGRSVGRAAFWAAVIVACARLAAWGLRSRLRGLSHLVWDGTAGLALLIGVLLLVGLVPGAFRPAVLAAMLAGLGLLAAWRLRADPVPRFRSAGPPDPWCIGLAWLLTVVAIVGLAWDRVPPVFFDSLAYHFAQPELWLINGRVAPESWSLHSWFPPGVSLLYGVGLALGGEPLANDANLLLGLLLLTMAFDLGRRLFGPPGGLAAASILAALPILIHSIGVPAADLGHGLFVSGALGALLLRRDGQPADDRDDAARWTVRAGVLAGGALLTKYLGFVVPLAVGAAWIALDRPHRLRDLARFALPALLLVAPWLVADGLVTGNPLAPVASSRLATRGLSDGGATSFRADARGGLPDQDDLRRLGGRWFSGADDESGIYPTPVWGWLPLVLAPAALLSLRRDRGVRRALGLVLVLVGVWWLTFRWERFLVAASLWLALALAGGTVRVCRERRLLRVLVAVAAVVGVLTVVSSGRRVAQFSGGAGVALGRESAEVFIRRSFATARLFARINQRLAPSTSHLLLVGEMRHYGLRVPRAAPTGFNVHPLVEALRAHRRPHDVHRALRRRGYTHLLLDPGWIARGATRYPSLAFLAERPEIFRRYVRSLGPPSDTEREVGLFEIPE
jgi:hypothetical protein